MPKNCTNNAKQMQSKSKTNAIKNVLVFAFALFLLCICVFLAMFFALFVRFLEKTQKNIAKKSTTNAQKMQTNATQSHIKRTNIEKKKRTRTKKVVCEIWLCMCIFFALFLRFFLNCCSALFLLFFWLPFAFFLLFDMHSF